MDINLLDPTTEFVTWPKKQRNKLKRDIAKLNASFGNHLTEFMEEHWPKPYPKTLQRVLRSRHFLVQIHSEGEHYRMTVNRTQIDETGRWQAGITWDELMKLKEEAGYGVYWAVEIYPPQDQVIDVSNMRHLWLLDEKPPYAWTK